jgi:hypothetical protein
MNKKGKTKVAVVSHHGFLPHMALKSNTKCFGVGKSWVDKDQCQLNSGH